MADKKYVNKEYTNKKSQYETQKTEIQALRNELVSLEGNLNKYKSENVFMKDDPNFKERYNKNIETQQKEIETKKINIRIKSKYFIQSAKDYQKYLSTYIKADGKEEKKSKIQSKINRLTNEEENLDILINQLRKQNEDIITKNDAIETSIKKLQTEIDNKENELSAKNNLLRDSNLKTEEREKISKERDELGSEINGLIKKRDSYSYIERPALNEIAELEKRKSSLAKEKEKLNEELNMYDDDELLVEYKLISDAVKDFRKFANQKGIVINEPENVKVAQTKTIPQEIIDEAIESGIYDPTYQGSQPEFENFLKERGIAINEPENVKVAQTKTIPQEIIDEAIESGIYDPTYQGSQPEFENFLKERGINQKASEIYKILNTQKGQQQPAAQPINQQTNTTNQPTNQTTTSTTNQQNNRQAAQPINQQTNQQPGQQPTTSTTNQQTKQQPAQQINQHNKQQPAQPAQQPTTKQSTQHVKITSIKISAKDNKVYVKGEGLQSGEINIEGKEGDRAITNGETIINSDFVNNILKNNGKRTRIQKHFAKKKINPVVLAAISMNGGNVEEYIKTVLSNGKYIFDYKIDLSESSLSEDTKNKLNKVALKERKTMPNSVIGAESKWDRFRKMFTRDNKALPKKEEIKRLEPTPKPIDKIKVDAEQNKEKRTSEITAISNKITAMIEEIQKLDDLEKSQKDMKMKEFLKKSPADLAKELGCNDSEIVSEALEGNMLVSQYRAGIGRGYKKIIFKHKKNAKGIEQPITDENGHFIINENMVDELSRCKSVGDIKKNYFQNDEVAEMIYNDPDVKKAREARGQEI